MLGAIILIVVCGIIEKIAGGIISAHPVSGTTISAAYATGQVYTAYGNIAAFAIAPRYATYGNAATIVAQPTRYESYPTYAAYGHAPVTVTSQHSNIVRSYGNTGQTSVYGKTIDTPYSSVRDSDLRITNPGVRYIIPNVSPLNTVPVYTAYTPTAVTTPEGSNTPVYPLNPLDSDAELVPSIVASSQIVSPITTAANYVYTPIRR